MKRIIFVLENGVKTYSMGPKGPDIYTPMTLGMLKGYLSSGATWGFTMDMKLFGPVNQLEEAGYNVLAITDILEQDANEDVIVEYLRER